MIHQKTKFIKAVILLVLLSVFAALLTFPIASSNSDFPNTEQANAVCLYNLNTQKNVYAVGMDKKLFPAGAVKMMTGLVACELLSERLQESVTVTEQMLKGTVGANIKLKKDMTVTVEDLLYGVLCGGGNDACLVLATLCGEDTEGFVSMMNDKADALGLKNTYFTNPTGIDDEDMYSTLSDIMIIAKEAQKNKLYMKISSTPSYTYTPLGTQSSIKFFNRNCLISTFYSLDYRNSNAEGMAVGNTDLGGYCVITYSKKGDTEYICAVMGATADSESIYSYKIANSLLSYAFDSLSYIKIAESGQRICTLPIKLALPTSSKDEVGVNCVIKNDIYALTDKHLDIENDLTYRYYFHSNPLNAPVRAGSIVGGVDIIYNGQTLGNAVLVAENDIYASEMLLLLENMKSFFISPFFISAAICFAVLLILYILIFEREHRYSGKRHSKYKTLK